jgi:hypothetical protein
MVNAINNWWGECILRCGSELTTLETYIIAITVLPFIVWFIENKK